MLVPRYWAEGRVHQPRRGRHGRQVTVRRWGWSDDSQEAAQTHADERAREALARIEGGETHLLRREPKVPYNGAEGVPIREEIVSRHGETIITRNSYGALCLNTPNVLFADVDFTSNHGCIPGCVGALVCSLAVGIVALGNTPAPYQPLAAIVGVLVGAFLGAWIPYQLLKLVRWLQGGPEAIAWRRLKRFMARRPLWSSRVYRSPAGLRVLVTHASFDPREREVAEFFRSLRTDPLYVTMCRKQACFRARLTPKPWRIGCLGHLKPRTGVWPIAPDRLPEREEWVRRYEQASEQYAACRYVDTLGSATTCPEALEVQRLHDELCRAHSDLPIA